MDDPFDAGAMEGQLSGAALKEVGHRVFGRLPLVKGGRGPRGSCRRAGGGKEVVVEMS
jgi:hypothetical protein